MFYILDKAWRIYYKNLIVHVFFSVLFLALPYAMYLLSKAVAGYAASAAIILALSAAEVFFGFFPFFVSVAKERITLLWKRLLRPAAFLSIWWSPLVTALYIAMQFCIRKELLTTTAAFPLFGAGFSILFFIASAVSARVVIALKQNGEKGALPFSPSTKKFVRILVAVSALLPAVLAFSYDAAMRAYAEPIIPPELTFALAVLFLSAYMPITVHTVCLDADSKDLNL